MPRGSSSLGSREVFLPHAASGTGTERFASSFTGTSTILCSRDNLTWLESEIAKSFEIKVRARIGEAPDLDKEVTILNRVLRLDLEWLHYEADPRHAELLVRSLGLDDSNGQSTPRINDTDIDVEAVLDQPVADDQDLHDPLDDAQGPEAPAHSLFVRRQRG